MSNPPEFDKAFRAARSLAVMLGASLPVYLLLEEAVRGRYRPFLGFAGLRDRAGLRLGGFACAVAAVVALRLLHGRLVARAAKAAGPAAAVRSLHRAAVVGATLAGFPALAGLGLFLAAGLNTDFYLLEFVSGVLTFMYFPRAAAWESVLETRRPVCPL